MEKNYKKYSDEQKTIQRRIIFEKQLAEEINKLIAIFNNEFLGFKLNNSILINIVLRDYLSHLKTLDECEAKEILKNSFLAYTMEEKQE